MKFRRVCTLVASAISAALMITGGTTAYAQQSSSSHYQVNEVFFGSGGELNTCSSNYCSKDAAGELSVGNTASNNYQAQGGFNTDRAPSLIFTVSGGSTNLGNLSSGSTTTTTSTFSVKTYLAGGYIVQTVSDPPKSNYPTPHNFNALGSPTASSTGTEQFGMNLVANTSPRTFGSDPVQVPNNTFGFGAVASGYNSANLYKYVKGDTVAASTKSSGETDFTISYIYNISSVTPDGEYTFNHVLVATSTY